MKGILARKVGMTQHLCQETGKVTPVTVLEAPANTILQVKSVDKDGYTAIVLGAFERKNFGKNENKKYKFIQELRLEDGDDPEVKKGDTLTLADLLDIEAVKVTGTSKGRGFAGVIKRYNFQRGRETHGSHHHREPGSSGMCAKPGRILRGKKFPGHMGNAKKTLRSTPVMEVDVENNLIALKGAIPGATNSYVFIRG